MHDDDPEDDFLPPLKHNLPPTALRHPKRTRPRSSSPHDNLISPSGPPPHVRYDASRRLNPDFVQAPCPVCAVTYPRSLLNQHANTCLDTQIHTLCQQPSSSTTERHDHQQQLRSHAQLQVQVHAQAISQANEALDMGQTNVSEEGGSKAHTHFGNIDPAKVDQNIQAVSYPAFLSSAHPTASDVHQNRPATDSPPPAGTNHTTASNLLLPPVKDDHTLSLRHSPTSDLHDFLLHLNIAKYFQLFVHNGLNTTCHIQDAIANDNEGIILAHMGLPLGTRAKLLDALSHLPKQDPLTNHTNHNTHSNRLMSEEHQSHHKHQQQQQILKLKQHQQHNHENQLERLKLKPCGPVLLHGHMLQNQTHHPKDLVSNTPATSRKRNIPDENHAKKIQVTFQTGHNGSTFLTTNLQHNSHMDSLKTENRRENLHHKDSKHPWYKIIPGTSFTIDSFRCDPHNCKEFFLTHFHYDHYGGLTKKFNTGKIYCTEITGNLIESILKVNPQHIVRCRYNVSYDIQDTGASNSGNGASVIFYDANHCPGATMLLFRVWKTGKTILHTGDFRYDSRIMLQHASLQQVIMNRSLDYLYLDTTYCDPSYDFPNQDSVLDEVGRTARREAFNEKTLFLVGSYTIGKEKVYFRIAEESKLLIFVGKEKRRILECLDLSREQRNMLCEDPLKARIHVVPIGSLNHKDICKYLLKFRRFTNAIVYRPTGWTWKKPGLDLSKKNAIFTFNSGSGDTGRGGGLLQRTQCDNIVTYLVPYSEHSSFTELKAMVKHCQAKQIVPTVNTSGKNKVDEMKRLLYM